MAVRVMRDHFLSGSLSIKRLLLKQSLSQLKSLMCFWWRNTSVSMAMHSSQRSGYLEIKRSELSSQHPLGKLFSFFGSSSHFREVNNLTSSTRHSWLHYVVFFSIRIEEHRDASTQSEGKGWPQSLSSAKYQTSKNSDPRPTQHSSCSDIRQSIPKGNLYKTHQLENAQQFGAYTLTNH